MKLPLSIAEKLVAMQNGEEIPFSALKHDAIESMLENGILKTKVRGRSKIIIYLSDQTLLPAYLKNHFGIENLENYISFFKQDNISRADAVAVSSDSKLVPVRTFKGFLVNCFQPVACVLHNEPVIIQPQEGTFTFIYDYEMFLPAADVTIVGIENPENFRQIRKQKGLFRDHHTLFISRYPQNKDMIKWLQKIPNRYLHFGDFDFAGLNIYYHEYKKWLGEKAQFFLPDNIENILSQKGNRDNYNNQKLLFDKKEITEANVSFLLHLIETYKKGLEQEIFAK